MAAAAAAAAAAEAVDPSLGMPTPSGMATHEEKDAASSKTSGATKCSRLKSSPAPFCSGVPVNSSRGTRESPSSSKRQR